MSLQDVVIKQSFHKHRTTLFKIKILHSIFVLLTDISIEISFNITAKALTYESIKN
jgi:hypothetical protein